MGLQGVRFTHMLPDTDVVLTDCSHTRWHQAVRDETGRQSGGPLAWALTGRAHPPSAVSNKDRRLKSGRWRRRGGA
jgi:hypothetical protein